MYKKFYLIDTDTLLRQVQKCMKSLREFGCLNLHEFLDNMAEGDLSTAEKTRLDRRKKQSEMELSMLQSMMESASMQNYSIPDLDDSFRPVFNH